MSEVEAIEVSSPQEFQKMPSEYKDLLTKSLMLHTEGELTGADDYALIFYPMAPNIYEKTVCFERGIEELRHYELGAAVLSDIGVDSSYMLKQKLSERNLYQTEGVQDIRNWAERALFSFIGEAVVMQHLEEWTKSSYKPIREMVKPVIKDEKVHIAHGYRITRDMCKTIEGKEQIQTALNRQWSIALDMFGTKESERSKLNLKWGLRQLSHEDARNKFIEYITPKLLDLGLTVPDHLKNRKII